MAFGDQEIHNQRILRSVWVQCVATIMQRDTLETDIAALNKKYWTENETKREAGTIGCGRVCNSQAARQHASTKKHQRLKLT